MVDIRPVEPGDRDDWQRLWDGYLDFYETALDPSETETTFARILDASFAMHAAIARDGEGIAVGLVQWLPHPATWSRSGYCYLEDLYVVPEARGTGVGAALIQHVRDWAEAQGLSKLYWLTAEDNTAARALYDRVAEPSGFVQYHVQL